MKVECGADDRIDEVGPGGLVGTAGPGAVGTPGAVAPCTVVDLPEPIRPTGYAERTPYKLTWAGGVHLLGAGLIVIPGRTLDNPEDARAHAAAVLAAAAHMQAGR